MNSASQCVGLGDGKGKGREEAVIRRKDFHGSNMSYNLIALCFIELDH